MVRYQVEEDFIGRNNIMDEIGQRFKTKNRLVAAGIGGVGYALPDCSSSFGISRKFFDFKCRKSRVAIEYCYKYRNLNLEAHIFWVHGGSRARF